MITNSLLVLALTHQTPPEVIVSEEKDGFEQPFQAIWLLVITDFRAQFLQEKCMKATSVFDIF